MTNLKMVHLHGLGLLHYALVVRCVRMDLVKFLTRLVMGRRPQWRTAVKMMPSCAS